MGMLRQYGIKIDNIGHVPCFDFYFSRATFLT